MVRDVALRSVFMRLFASLCGMLRVSVRPDCHHSCHQRYGLDYKTGTPLRACAYRRRFASWGLETH
jgi:hypothetical protein